MHCNFVGQPHDHPHEDEIEDHEDEDEPHRDDHADDNNERTSRSIITPIFFVCTICL